MKKSDVYDQEEYLFMEGGDDDCTHVPNCPNCGNNRQVWVNQITGVLTCHRYGCHIEIPNDIREDHG